MARDLNIPRRAPRKRFLLKAGLSIFLFLLIQNPLRQPEEFAEHFQVAAAHPELDQDLTQVPETEACLVALGLSCAE
jgi:hypothetical protein